MRHTHRQNIAPEVKQARSWIGLLFVGLASCVAPMSRSAASVQYVCVLGEGFTAIFSPKKVMIKTAAGAYRLPQRDGSLERYGSENVAFIRDGTSRVLVGADGGPFDSCTEADTQVPAGSGT